MRGIASKYRSLVVLASLFVFMYLLGIVQVKIGGRTRNVVDMKEADRDDAVLVTVTRDGKLYFGDEVHVIDNLTEIRVRNASDFNLDDVVIDGEKFGDVKQGAITEYRKSKLAHRYPSASLTANSRRLEAPPIVNGADTELGHGRFTYVITIQNDHLAVRAEMDNQ